MADLKLVEVKFKVHINEPGGRLNRAILRDEMSMFAQHLLTAYDETILDGEVDGEQIHYPMLPDENRIN